VKAHFVTFYSPGTFVAEDSTLPIPKWDVPLAKKMSKKIVERYGARPYGFRFSTRKRGPGDLDSKVVKTSATYYIGGKVRTIAEVEREANPGEAILLENMKCNGWGRVWTSTEGWKWSQPLGDDDIVLPGKKPAKGKAKR
jgi:hypothetical protein